MPNPDRHSDGNPARRVQLIHWNPTAVQSHIAKFKSAGYHIEIEPFDGVALRRIKAEPPDAILIDLSRRPSQGRDVGIQLRKHTSTRKIPLIFVGGISEKVEAIRQILPDAGFTTWRQIFPILEHTLANPPENSIVPNSVFAGYAGSPLPQFARLIKQAQLLTSRLERLPPDSVWARRASGYRGTLLRLLSDLDKLHQDAPGRSVNLQTDSEFDLETFARAIEHGFFLLNQAAQARY